MGPPTDLALKMKPLLCTILVVQTLLSICRFIIGDFGGGLCVVLTVAVGYMATKEMSTSLIFMYFAMNACNCVFDFLYSLLRLFDLGWNYFDPNMPLIFNLASLVLPASGIMAATAAIVSYRIFADQRDQVHEAVPFAPSFGQSGPGMRFYGEAPARPPAPGQIPPGVQVFGGKAHRLGGSSQGPGHGPAAGQAGAASQSVSRGSREPSDAPENP